MEVDPETGMPADFPWFMFKDPVDEDTPREDTLYEDTLYDDIPEEDTIEEDTPAPSSEVETAPVPVSSHLPSQVKYTNVSALFDLGVAPQPASSAEDKTLVNSKVVKTVNVSLEVTEMDVAVTCDEEANASAPVVEVEVEAFIESTAAAFREPGVCTDEGYAWMWFCCVYAPIYCLMGLTWLMLWMWVLEEPIAGVCVRFL